MASKGSPKGSAARGGEQEGRLEISRPMDFEHFLHVGATNLSDVTTLCADQNSLFQDIVAKRAGRKLPKVRRGRVCGVGGGGGGGTGPP